jgi:polar amino acid transport system substrate-binding protein
VRRTSRNEAAPNSRPLLALLLGVAAVTACVPLPRDPERTLERVQQQHQMRVGLVENPPWVIRTTGEPAGVEVDLVRQFAASLGTTPEWFWGAEQPHMAALGRFELDLVIAGLEATTPWAKEIGLTRPYFEESVAVGMPPGIPLPETLKGMKITVKSGEATAAYLLQKQAIPVRVNEILLVLGPAAAPAWQLQKRGFRLTRFQLFERKHVMAVPPGENGWLKRLGDFLQQQRPKIQTLLETREAQP